MAEPFSGGNSIPPGIVIAAVTTTGYAGMLLGPAMIGFVSGATLLVAAFWLLGGFILAVPLTAGWVAATFQTWRQR